MNNVTYLPTATNAPVINSGRRIRRHSNIYPMRATIKTGDLVRITAGLNVGKLCRVAKTRLDRILIQPLKGTLLCKDTCEHTEAWITRNRIRRVADQAMPPRYALPAWPTRWEASLKKRAEGEA